MRTSTISKTERYIDKIYDKTMKSELKKEILIELQHKFPSENKGNGHLEEFIQSLNDQISILKNEINFLREELKEKDHVVRILLNMRCKPSENYGTTSCSNHSSGKSSNWSSNNNYNINNNNISRNKINDNISNNTINTDNIRNNNNKTNNSNDNIGNIINDNNNNINNITRNDNINNNKISNNNIINSNTSNNNTSNNNDINNVNNSNNNIRNIETTKKNGTEDNMDKEKSKVNNLIQKTKRVYILGDSTIKHVKGYTISSLLDNCKVYVKDFPEARVRCMQDYVRPTLRENPDHITIHIGTNHLASNTPAEKVAESIIDLASTLKSDSCSVAISSITVRNDKHRNKVAQVNRSLKRLCQKNNFELINHENTNTERHLNGSRLHLNKRGTTILSNNFTEAISNSIQ